MRFLDIVICKTTAVADKKTTRRPNNRVVSGGAHTAHPRTHTAAPRVAPIQPPPPAPRCALPARHARGPCRGAQARPAAQPPAPGAKAGPGHGGAAGPHSHARPRLCSVELTFSASASATPASAPSSLPASTAARSPAPRHHAPQQARPSPLPPHALPREPRDSHSTLRHAPPCAVAAPLPYTLARHTA